MSIVIALEFFNTRLLSALRFLPAIFALRMRSIVLLAAAFLFLTQSACERKAPRSTYAREAVYYDPHFQPLSDTLENALRDSARTFYYDHIQNGHFNGAILVAKNGKVVFEHYPGVADHENKTPMAADVPVHVASISKTITAVTVLRLVDQGKIALDSSVSHYIRRFPYRDITVRTLLNHRSGLPYYGYLDHGIWPHNKTLTNKDLLSILNSGQLKLNFPPNTHFAYCNTNYALLALIVEKVTRRKFPNAVSELIFEPLHMEHSFIYTPKRKNDKRAKSYNSRGILQEENYLDQIYGDKNLYTTARDLLKFDSGTYSDDFLSKDAKKEMFKGYSYEKAGKANYGLGIRMREEAGKKTLFFHTGWWHGNTACYATLREDSACMIVISNHYNRRIFGINFLSLAFGNYPYNRPEKSPAVSQPQRRKGR